MAKHEKGLSSMKKRKAILKSMRGDTTTEKIARVQSSIEFNRRLLAYMKLLDDHDERDRFIKILGNNLVDILSNTINLVTISHIDVIHMNLQDLIWGFVDFAYMEKPPRTFKDTSLSHDCVLVEEDETVYFTPGMYLIGRKKTEENARIYFIERYSRDLFYVFSDEFEQYAVMQIFPNSRVKYPSGVTNSKADSQFVEKTLAIRSATPSFISILYNDTKSGFKGDEISHILYKNGLMNPIIIPGVYMTHATTTDTNKVIYLYNLAKLFHEPEESSLIRKTRKELSVEQKTPNDLDLWQPGTFHATKIIRTGITHSYTEYVLGFIRWACENPNAKKIQMTMYRLSACSPIIDWLESAAKRGVRVNVYIELSARGDEANNLAIFRRLRAHNNIDIRWGAISDIKAYAKLFVLTEDTGIQWMHTSTGNYNEERADQTYDIQVFTRDCKLIKPMVELFESLMCGNILCTAYTDTGLVPYYSDVLPISGYSSVNSVNHFIMTSLDRMRAPAGYRRIIFKVNHFLDERIFNTLVELASDGVEIDLIIRTTIPPQLQYLRKDIGISVYSAVGKKLEHDRIFYFEFADGTRQAAISSADLMYRNLYNRAESLCIFPPTDSEWDDVTDNLLTTLLQYIPSDDELSQGQTTWYRPSIDALVIKVF